VSAYLDLRPEVGNPQVRSGLIVLRDALRAADHDEFVETMTARIEAELLPEAIGAAVFTDGGDNWVALPVAGDVANDVSVGARARLAPLARLADFDPALVAVADTNTLRVYAMRSGTLIELGVLDDDPDDYSKHSQGGWSQRRFQAHVDEHRERFAELAAEALAALAERESADVLVLAADEAALGHLRDALPKPLADKVRATVKIHIRATDDEVNEIVLPELARIREEDARDLADRVIDAANAEGLGIYGANETRAALELGQVHELLLDSGVSTADDAVIDETAEDLVRMAAATDARIRFVDHDGLRQRDGVGGLLRFRLDRAANEPVDEADSDAGATVSPTGEPIRTGSD
jgi:protein required for attachment to host cells